MRGFVGRVIRGAVLGGLLSVPLTLLFKAGQLGAGTAFPPFDIFELVSRVLPGRLVIFTIESMVSIITALGVGPTSVAAKSAEKGIAIIQFAGMCAALGALIAAPRAGGRLKRAGTGLLAGAVLAVVEAAAEILPGLGGGGLAAGLAWPCALLIIWGGVTGWAIGRTEAPTAAQARASRRSFLAHLVEGVVVLSAALLGAVGWLDRLRPEPAKQSKPATQPSGGEGAEWPEPTGRLVKPVHGTRRELDSNQDFYRIDINLDYPKVEAADWKLTVDGLVDNPLAFTLEELKSMPAVSQYITLECISNPVGGDLIGTSRWTGVRLSEVLERAKVRAGAKWINMEAADGYYESVGMDDARDARTLLVHTMNGKPLPQEHGFPLRIYIQNRHGMKQPKWITRMTVANAPHQGYWVERGWDNAAIVHTTSVIDAVSMVTMVGGVEVLLIGGMAYAGGRGISKVEVQADGGPWARATLIAPPLSGLTWVLWRYEWPYVAGKHTFRVRAYDGTGVLQEEAEHGPYPSGATGYFSKTVMV